MSARRRRAVVVSVLLVALLAVSVASAATYRYTPPTPGAYAGTAKPATTYGTITAQPFPVRFGVKGLKLRRLQLGPTAQVACTKASGVVGVADQSQTMTVPKLKGFPQLGTAADAFTYVTWTYRNGTWKVGSPNSSSQKVASASINFSYSRRAKAYTGTVAFSVYLNDAGAFDPKGDWHCPVNSAALTAHHQS